MYGLAVDEPQLVDAERARPLARIMRDRLGIQGIGDVEQLDAGGIHVEPGIAEPLGPHGLVCDGQDVATEIERVGPHLAVGKLGLDDDFGFPRVGHVDAGEILGRALVGEPHDASPAGELLDRHALADATVAGQRVVADQFHVVCFVPAHGFLPC